MALLNAFARERPKRTRQSKSSLQSRETRWCVYPLRFYLSRTALAGCYLTWRDTEGILDRRGIVNFATFDHSIDLIDVANVLSRVAVD